MRRTSQLSRQLIPEDKQNFVILNLDDYEYEDSFCSTPSDTYVKCFLLVDYADLTNALHLELFNKWAKVFWSSVTTGGKDVIGKLDKGVKRFPRIEEEYKLMARHYCQGVYTCLNCDIVMPAPVKQKQNVLAVTQAKCKCSSMDTRYWPCESTLSFYVVCIHNKLYGIVRKGANHADNHPKNTFDASPKTAFKIKKVTDLIEVEPR